MNRIDQKMIGEKLLREAGQVLEEFYRQTLDEVVTDLRIRCLIDKDAEDTLDKLHGIHFSKIFYQHNDSSVVYVRDAIARFVEGNYGACQECGTEIPQQWLMRSPLIEYCSGCMVRVSPSHRKAEKRSWVAR